MCEKCIEKVKESTLLGLFQLHNTFSRNIHAVKVYIMHMLNLDPTLIRHSCVKYPLLRHIIRTCTMPPSTCIVLHTQFLERGGKGAWFTISFECTVYLVSVLSLSRRGKGWLVYTISYNT